jgi:hypothetical protein
MILCGLGVKFPGLLRVGWGSRGLPPGQRSPHGGLSPSYTRGPYRPRPVALPLIHRVSFGTGVERRKVFS